MFKSYPAPRWPHVAKIWECCSCKKPNSVLFGNKRFRCKLCHHRQCQTCCEIDEGDLVFAPLPDTLRGYRERDSMSDGEDDEENHKTDDLLRRRRRSASPRGTRTAWPEAEDFGLEEVVNRISNAVVLKDKATGRSADVEIPKGYAMSASFLTTDREILEKRERLGVRDSQLTQRGVLRSPVPRFFGFKPEDLIKYDILEKEYVESNNLTTDIHPMLIRNHWTNVPDDVYDTLLPALRLVSMFLTHPCAMQFFIDLLFGERELDWDKIIETEVPQQRIPFNLSNNDKQSAGAIDYLRKIGSAIDPEHGNIWNFKFNIKLDPEDNGFRCFGYNRNPRGGSDQAPANKDLVERYLADLPTGLQRVAIILHGDFYVVAKKILDTKHYPEDQKLRFYFLFASVLMHEVRHYHLHSTSSVTDR